MPHVDAALALPSVEHLYDSGVRRPGELHEPFDLDTGSLRRAEAAARRAALPLGLTVGLLVEAELARADLASIAGTAVEGVLDEAAALTKVTRQLSAGEADYLRLLRGAGFSRTLPTLPVRVLGRARALDLAAALDADVARAARWEAAALLDGRTMLEWSLLALARGD